jgi:predicted small metal-binding protein
MAKEVTCPPCGEVITADGDDELIAKVQTHAKEHHDMDVVDREHILAEAREVNPRL